MTSRTTALELQRSRAGRYAFVILIEGLPLAFTTSEDLAGVRAAWADTAWQSDDATWFQSAFLPGQWSQQIEWFNPKIRAEGCSFRVLDRNDYLAGLIFGNGAATARTWLTADLANDATAIEVMETGGFTASGDFYIYIGNETIRVSSDDQTATGWTTSERAQWALERTQADAPFAPRHRINTINGNAPKVTDRVTCWYNRRVAIYMHHSEAGSSSWSTAAQALLVWEGFLRTPVDNGDRSITFNAVHVNDMLNRVLFEDQFRADVREGAQFNAPNTKIVVAERISGGSSVYYETTFEPGWYTWKDLVGIISAALVPATSGVTMAWAISMETDYLQVSATAMPGVTPPLVSDGNTLALGLSGLAWDVLGWSRFKSQLSGIHVEQAAGVSYNFYTLTLPPYAIAGDLTHAIYKAVADWRPMTYAIVSTADTPNGELTDVRLTNMQGTYTPQPSFGDLGAVTAFEGVPEGTEVYLQFADLAIYGGYVVDGVFTVTHYHPQQFTSLGFDKGIVAPTSTFGFREGDIQGLLTVKQVWYQKAHLNDLLLRLVLSTGVNGYNHADYDVNPVGMGAGVPFSLLDEKSWKALPSDVWVLALTGPTELARLLESALATYGRYLVWRPGGNGSGGSGITLVHPHVDGPSIAVAHHLTDDNKADKNDRVRAEHAADGIINRVEFKYNRDLKGTFQSTEIVEDVVSTTDFGKQRTVSVEAWGIETFSGAGLPSAGAQLAGEILAFFSRPMTIIERTITKALISITPGDTVLISDPYLIDPRTGTRGMVNFPAWVMAMSFEPKAMAGKVRCAFSGEFPTDKICQWAWSARVDHDADNGGYNVGDTYLVVLPDRYQRADLDPDDTGTVAGDAIRVRELSPRDPQNPLEWSTTVISVDAVTHRIYLADELDGWDPDRFYVVTPDAILFVENGQLINTFIADDATDSTGYNANDSYVWGTAWPSPRESEILLQDFVTPPRDGSVWDAGQPLAVADIYEATLSANVLAAYKTRHLIVSQIWTDDVAVTAGAGKELIYGPLPVPLYSHGGRKVLVRLYCCTSDGGTPATFTVTLAKSPPQGPAASLNVHYVDPSPGSASDATTSTSKTWLVEMSIPAYPDLGREPPIVFLTVEAETGDAGVQAKLYGICAFEDHG